MNINDIAKLITENIDEVVNPEWVDPKAERHFRTRSQVFSALFGDYEMPSVKGRYQALKKVKTQIDPKVYAECLENVLDSVLLYGER